MASIFMETINTIVHLRGDETGAELGEEMRRLAAAAEKYFALPVVWEDFDLSLGKRTETKNGIVTESADRVREIGIGVKDATISLEPDDRRPGMRGSPNAILRKRIQDEHTLGTIILREAKPLPGVPPRIPGSGYETFGTSVVREGAGGFYNAAVSYEDPRRGVRGEPRRNDLEQIVHTDEPVPRGQHRVAAMYAFRLAHETGAVVVGGPKFTIHDGDGSLQREIRRARDVFSGKPVVALTGEGIRYVEDTNDTIEAYRHEIAEERRRLNLPGEGISERALAAYNEWLIDALYAWLVDKGPGTLREGDGADIVIPTTNRDGDCVSDLVAPIYSSVAGMTSEIMAVNKTYEPTAVIAEAAHGTAPRSFRLNRANPLAMFLALSIAYKRLGEMHARRETESEVAKNYRRASEGVRRACMAVIGDGQMTQDLARRMQQGGRAVKKVLKMGEFTEEVAQHMV